MLPINVDTHVAKKKQGLYPEHSNGLDPLHLMRAYTCILVHGCMTKYLHGSSAFAHNQDGSEPNKMPNSVRTKKFFLRKCRVLWGF